MVRGVAPLPLLPLSLLLTKPTNTHYSWENKRVLITGASSGLGQQIAILLAKKNANLVLAARRTHKLHKLAEVCNQTTQATVMQLDLAKFASTSGRVDQQLVQQEQIDLLICAAGVGQRSLAVETDFEDHAHIMRTNFDGHVRLTQLLLPQMLQRGDGAIVAVSSVQGFFGQPGRSSYAASKAALVGYYDSLRAEVADSGVHVMLVAPGYIATDHSASAIGGDGNADNNSLRGMSAEELARIVVQGVEEQVSQMTPAQPSAHVAIYLRALWPSLFFKLMRARARRKQ